MSNLKLKNLSYKELTKLPEGKRRKIAYATHAENKGSMVVVYHHDNPIAGVHKDKVELDWCGWNSNTTRDRLHRVLMDNLTYKKGISVSKHNYAGVLSVWTHYGNQVHIPFDRATVYKNGEVKVH